MRLFSGPLSMFGAKAQIAALEKLEHKSDEVYFPRVIRLMGLQHKPEDSDAVAARMGAGMNEATPKLLEWRGRMTARPAVRQVVGPMVAYLVSRGRAVPDFLLQMQRS